jgi:hypothetical protein
VTPEDIAELTSPAGRVLLDSLPPYAPDLAMKLSEGLRRRGLPPRLVAAALTQSRLRQRAESKLGEFARTMLFTDAGLQQATRLKVAAHHARRYRGAGLTHVADLTCGIGVDSMTMAALGLRVTAAEVDPTTAAVARHNLHLFPSAQVIEADGLTLDLDGLGVDAVFADPSRRTGAGRRVFNPAAYTPPLDRLLALGADRPLGLKIAPGVPHAALPPHHEAQWVSDDGTVVECTLWAGPLARLPGAAGRAGRSALVLSGDQATQLDEQPGARLASGQLGDFLLEPDGAIVRGSLIAEAASAAGLDNPRLVHPRIAYVTADGCADTANLFAAFRVVDVIPYKVATLRAYLRARGVGHLTIKKRGIDVDPDSLRNELRLRGEAHATAVLTRVAGRHSVIVVTPCLRQASQEH